MIVDRIENEHLYKAVSPRIAKALELLGSKDIGEKAEGKHEVETSKLYFLVQNYTTKPRSNGLFEAHKKYLDIQFVVDGEESIFVEHISKLKESKAYNEKDEAALYDQPSSFSEIRMSKGMFCILFPEDGHGPCRTMISECKVHKIVFKVAID
ncbi:MAG: hypothetical protein A2Y07_06195 [Planctomycetes bacterium GWF2_50_10]|nr:MAG: hypothetical protein A2Y07_06195 [Planctomycetes bacterium GWF2_50_10]